ncbi:MAG: AAA family ATPase [Deltaproteobacteria bacterium]|nr:AAA family ATPase [Deltaproteobacteria bacterium]
MRGEDDRPVVLKVLTSQCDDALHRARLLRELEVARGITAPTVVQAYGSTHHEGRLALVLEDFGGEALSLTLPARAALSVTLPIAIQIARALADVHRARIVHRDVKPSNFIHRPSTGEIKITDFGVALREGEVRTEPGAGFEGTLAYMAPESSGRLGRPVDQRADLYSLGVVLYELFVGGQPFHATDALQWMHCHTAQVPRALTELLPDLPEVLSQLVLKLLAKTPEERYQSASGVERDLTRALADLQNTGTISMFPLAERDVSDRFQLPDRVYGRAVEVRALHDAFTRVATTSHGEVVLISGAPGVGKTSLVRELLVPVARSQGYFASGKFDQYRGHLPYSAFIEASAVLVDQILTHSGHHLAAWKERLLARVDGNARTLVDLIPGLEQILGPLPPAPDLPPAAMQNRLHHLIRAFLGAFDHPVVLFLDDLQWADDASVALVESILANSGQVPVLLIIAYREHHAALDRLRATRARIQDIHLAALDHDAVCTLLRDTLHADPLACEQLAALAMSKTAGNAFFVREFVRTLQLTGLLRFDELARAWRFDPAEVETTEITDNVVELVVDRLRQLPAQTIDVLRIASVLGNDFETADLAAITRRSMNELAADLLPAVEQGLITIRQDGAPGARFSHDRVQEAAYELTPASERSALHLLVGRRFWDREATDGRGERLFETANHLVAAGSLITEPTERERLLELLVRAAHKAKLSTAYQQARSYHTRAAALLGESAWTSRFELAFDVHVELSECAYLGGDLDAARGLFDELLRRARTDLEQARIYYLQIRLFQIAGELAQAADVCLRAFSLFGLHTPASSEATSAIEEQKQLALQLLGDRPIAAHIDAPLMTDPRMQMLADLLEASGPPIYMVKPELFAWVALQLVNHSLRHGHTEASCYGYGIYALLRAAVYGDVDGGHEFSWLAIRLNEKLRGVKLEGCMLHLLGDHVNFWKNPIATDLPILERGFAACVRAGDHIYSNYIGFQAPWHLYEAGAPLPAVTALIAKHAAFAQETRYEAVHWTLRAEEQFVLALMGGTGERGSLDSHDFDEQAALTAVTAARFGCGIVYLHILQMIARYTFRDYAAALTAADLAAPELGSAFSMPIYASYGLYRALTLAALCRDVDAETRARYLAEIDAQQRVHGEWARACPSNFADKAALLRAELAWLTGDVPTAIRAYEEARLAARSQEMVQYEALACERAAEMYGALGVDFVRRALLADASNLYRRWGAAGKAADLLARNRGIGRRSIVVDPATRGSVSTQTTTGSELDLASVLKASQSLSEEIVLPRLLPRLMSIVIEYAGARRGSLLLLEAETLVVAASASIDAEALPNALPWSVLNYARRTGEHVLIDDASTSNQFGSDPYFQTQRRRSVLCQPIMRHGRMVGMFYLENDLVAGAFDPERLATLDILASQTAISVENSRLYEASQAAIVARDEFLSIASHELRTPLAPLAMQVHRLGAAVRKGTLREMPDAAITKLVTTCEAQIERMTRLVEALLDVSRIESGTMVLRREPIDLAAAVQDKIAAHADLAARAGCVVSSRLEAGLVGEWDRTQLDHVVTYLLRNAFKFGRMQPVELAVERAVGGAQLTITDHGVGVHAGDRERIFERFERVQSATNVDGLGLGLYMVRAFVLAHGGTVAVEETPGGGATFRVTLPLPLS